MTGLSRHIWPGIIMGMIIGVIIWKYEKRGQDTAESRRFNPFIMPFSLLIACMVLFLIILISRWFPMTYPAFWTISSLLQAGVYYTLLLIFHPVLRRTVSGTDRAILWVLPNVRYLFYYVDIGMPSFWVIPLKMEWLIISLIVWGCGAVLVMTWAILSHIRFRRKILSSAYAAPEETLAILRMEEQKLKPVKTYSLLISQEIKTPLSIGLFDRSLRIMLPEKEYSAEELRLIFRHELVHIRRMDNWTKLFLTVCTAFSWFNPFVWFSRRCAGEDFESGCDELVLAGEDDMTRKMYAELILDAADARGFTTCLSADTVSLRSRLKDVIKPKEKLAGAVIAGLLTFLLFFTGCAVGIAYDGQRSGTILFQDIPADIICFDQIYYTNGMESRLLPKGTNIELAEYLSGIQLYRLMADLEDNSEPMLSAFCATSEGTIFISLHEHTVSFYNEQTLEFGTYYHFENVDWKELLAYGA